ncbi:hypothetical protein B0H14DRAFT_3700910 [Mycena olivaceomarginata]|nr:hypothetical protein B0H14DRAFT_3700910 [Mycena olivaceomarginata]
MHSGRRTMKPTVSTFHSSEALNIIPFLQAMLLDVMDNLPRCRFTSAQMALVIHFANQLGAPDVPSLKGLRKIQQNLQSACGSNPVKTRSHLGNVFYMNDIRDSVSRDMANPLVAPHMHFYPEDNTGPVSETYQAERWMEYTPSQLTPMFSKGFKRFWIDEIAPPVRWNIYGVLTSDVSIVTHTADGRWKHHPGVEKTVAADDLDLDYRDLTADFGEVLVWVDNSTVPAMPNPMRKLVDDDEDLYVIMVSPWADDQYNKHMNMYTGNGCLPGPLLQQEFHIHYQFATFRDHVRSTEEAPVKCYNAVTKRSCRFILRTPGLPADNPQQSEEASHMGSNANFPCRKCNWGGTKLEKEGDEMYHTCHLAGVARSAKEIQESLEEQLRLSMQGDSKAVEGHQRNSGTKDKILVPKAKALKAEHPQWTRDKIASDLKRNPLLDIDTPVELLHTILLGMMKYIWHLLNTSQWSDADRQLFAIRLQSTDLSGLTVPPIRAGYMIQYKNNLIGKHFKTLMQALMFHFSLIKAAGDLGALLWIPEIHDMEHYLAQLEIAIANVLDAFDVVDPLRILTKIKLHLLAHIPDDVRRFGPLIRVATEIYEAYNGVFRLCSLYSNRLAPSRDISRKFASMSRVKHFLSGGYWWDAMSKQWIQAGNGVQQILLEDPVFQRHLGWVSPNPTKPGFIKPAPLVKSPVLNWCQTKTSKHWGLGTPPSPQSHWRLGRVLTAKSSDSAGLNSWVIALDSKGGTLFGRISELLVGEESLVTLEQFICGQERHPDFGWPILCRPSGAEITQNQVQSFVILPATSVQFVISVQHDCRRGDCQPTIVRKELQEREETDRTTSLIKHTDDDHFVLNMSALHNSAQLRRALPRSLTDIQPLYGDRLALHKLAAEKARDSRKKGRAKTAEKRRATAAAKKRDAELAAAAAELATQRAAGTATAGDDSDSDNDSDRDSAAAGVEVQESDAEDDDYAPGGSTQKRCRKRARRG